MSGIRILKNASYLFAGNVLVRLVSAVASILVARYLGVRDYAVLSVGLAFATVAGYFTDMGLSHTFIREGTRREADLAALLGGFFKIRLLFGFVTAAVSAAVIETVYRTPEFRQVLYWIVVPTIFGAALQGVGAAYFQVLEKMQYTALIRTISGLAAAGSLFAGMALGWPLSRLAPLYGFSNLAGGLFSLWLVARRERFWRKWHGRILEGLGSFTLGGLVIMALSQMGTLILERVADLRQVGYFAAAFRIPSVLYQIPGVLAEAYYPQLFACGNRGDLAAHLRLGVLELKTMSALGILMGLPFLLYPEWWVVLLFGPEWAPAAHALEILGWVAVLQSVNYPLADALTTKGMQRRRTAVLVAVLGIGLGAYVMLGSRWGSTGGAVAALLTEGVSLIGFVVANPTGWVLFIRGVKINALVLAGVWWLGWWWIRFWPPWFGIPAVWILFAAGVGVWDSDFRERGKALWRSRIAGARVRGGKEGDR